MHLTATDRALAADFAGSLDPSKKKSKRGFASMSKEQRRKIASMGGTAAHRAGRAHQFTSEEARLAAVKSIAARKLA